MAFYSELDMLRQHKPPPIWRIRISDFGLPDPKRDPDRHQNCFTWSLSHAVMPYPSRPHRKHNLLLRGGNESSATAGMADRGVNSDYSDKPNHYRCRLKSRPGFKYVNKVQLKRLARPRVRAVHCLLYR